MKSVSADRWAVVDRAFEAVLLAPPDRRDQVLRDVTAGDPELALEVEALLACEARGEEVLGNSALEFAPELMDAAVVPEEGQEHGPVSVGPYRVIREIARGGMGRVFLAVRNDPDLPQRVALKLVKRGMDTDELLLRFRQEGRILASLNHPGIARLLDGGAADDGRPYLVMEYVEGTSLRDHVAGDVPLEERLGLLVQICMAVGFAHRNLVIHRDLKPSNVMVTPTGEIRLLDFGIARLLHPEPVDGGPTAPVTRMGRRILTPEWASPEQLSGDPLTTASDVYQLGLLLRWLMTQGLPPAPRDLRLVAARALDADPTRRYASAEDLAADLQRFLEDRPVLARAPSLPYRTRKFIRRNPVPVAAGGVVLVMGGIFAGLYTAGIAHERDVARFEADRAGAALDFVTALFEGADPEVAGGDTMHVFQLLDRGEERLQTHLAGRPELRSEIEGVLGRLFTELGEFQRAEVLLLSALSAEEPTPGPPVLRTLAQLRFRQGRFDEADSLLVRAQALAEETSDRELLAGVLIQRAGVLTYTAQAVETEALLLRASGLLDGLETAEPLRSEARIRLGTHLMLEGRYPEAEELLLVEVAARREAAPEGTAALADALNNLGNLYQRSGRADEAMEAHSEALEIRRRIFTPDHPDISLSLNNLGTVAAGAGDFARAADWMTQAIEVLQARVGRENRNVALSIMNLGWIRMRAGALDEAEEWYRESIGIFQRTTGSDSPDTGAAVGNLAQLLQLQGRLSEAEAEAREALRIREAAHGPESMHVAWRSWLVAEILMQGGRLADAEPFHTRSLVIRRLHYPETHPEVTRGRNSLGGLLMAMERWDEARELFAAAVEAFEQDPAVHADELASAREQLQRALDRYPGDSTGR